MFIDDEVGSFGGDVRVQARSLQADDLPKVHRLEGLQVSIRIVEVLDEWFKRELSQSSDR